MAAISGIPRLCVFAAPQKQTATVWVFDIRLAVTALRRNLGSRRPSPESAMWRLTAFTTVAGGRARKKQQRVKIKYVATFMKTLKMTEPFGSRYKAPVLKALENVALDVR